MTTIELSTSIPIASDSPDNDIILIERPEKYIITIAVSTLNGILNATTSVGRISVKKTASIKIASSAPITMLDTMLCISILIYSP